jgi:hypothetical protein
MRQIVSLFFWITLLLDGSVIARADEFTPLKDPQKLLKPVVQEWPFEEEFARVEGARIVIVDYELLRRDFVETRTMSNSEIDAWLLKHTAFISKSQAAQHVVNTPIATSAERVRAFRPKEYKRAAVFRAGSGLIDVKGSGAPRPKQADHGNGLASLGEGIREFVYEKLVRKIFEQEGRKHQTLGTYAILDYGFDVVHQDGSRSPAGAILRQGHARFEGDFAFSLMDEGRALEVELLLRKYGITTAGAHRKHPEDLINVQGTKEGLIIDFGAFLTVERFEKPIRHIHGRVNLMEMNDPRFVQPNPLLRVDFSRWGTSITGVQDTKYDNPWVWSHEFAENWRKGTATRDHAWQHYLNLVGAQELRWKATIQCVRKAIGR